MSARPSVLGVRTVATPWGPFRIAAHADGIVAGEFHVTEDGFAAGLVRRFGAPPLPGAEVPVAVRRLLDETSAQVAEHVAGRRRAFDVPIDLEEARPWDRAVLDGVRTIPFGAVTSYGRLAGLIGRPGAARAVGGAVGRNPIGLFVPCHRVIAGDGGLGGYGGGWFGTHESSLDLKRALLAHEGVTIPARRLFG